MDKDIILKLKITVNMKAEFLYKYFIPIFIL